MNPTRWREDSVLALSPADLALRLRSDVLKEPLPNRFWKAATSPLTASATAATLEALIAEVDYDRRRLKDQARSLHEADDRATLKRVDAHRAALKQARLRYEERLAYVRGRARNHGRSLAPAPFPPAVPAPPGSHPAPAAPALQPAPSVPAAPVDAPPHTLEPTRDPVQEPAPTDKAACPRKAPARRPGASKPTQPRPFSSRGWVFDSSDDTHVAVCPDCSWRTMATTEDRMLDQAGDHAAVAHDDRRLTESITTRRARAAHTQ